MPKKFVLNAAKLLMTLLVACPSPLKAEAGPPVELSIPTCEGTLSLCLQYRKASDEELLRLRAQVDGLKRHGDLIESQRDGAFDLAQSSAGPTISPEVAAVAGAGVGALIVLVVVALIPRGTK